MRPPTKTDDFPGKWEECTVPIALIKEFIDQFGENATWEEWCTFLQEHKVEAFDWSTCD